MRNSTVTTKKRVPTMAPPKATPRPVTRAVKEPTPERIRSVPELPLEGGEVWRMSGRHGVAYVKNAAVAGELLAVDPKNLVRDAMAVYYDKKGKAIAWQIRFDTDRWEEVHRKLKSSS